MFKYKRKKFKLAIFNFLKVVFQRVSRQKTELTCFVAGHQRSGTNMVMDVLEKHWHTTVFHETDNRAFDNYMMRPSKVIANLRNKASAKLFVVKALCELDLLDSLMKEFKPAKTIWVIRHYNDVVNSMVRSFNTSASFYKKIKEDRTEGLWRSRNLSDENYQRIFSLVNHDISEESAAALQWAIRNLIFFEKNFDTNKDVLLINYESLVKEPNVTFPNIFSFLSIDNSPNSYKHVHDSSVGKNKTPEIDPRIKELCEDVWQKFAPRLDEVKAKY
ncbi:MAG: hypothetical protein ACI9O6_000695 [Glaciecola sp.]